MGANVNELLAKLYGSLDDLVKVYRHLLEVVRRERDILISANLDDLNENNVNKETTLLKIRDLENIRIQATEEICAVENLNVDSTRLLDLAQHFKGEVGQRLAALHSVLDLLLKRVQEHNKSNEVLIQSALERVTGAMKAVRDNFAEKPTYQRKGEMAAGGPGASGNIVSREA